MQAPREQERKGGGDTEENKGLMDQEEEEGDGHEKMRKNEIPKVKKI